MKFGGTSVGDAERILAVTEIVRQRLELGPVVVVSALGGVTDLLEAAIDTACRDDREAAEPILADLERRHRWALTGSVESADRRHHVNLEVDRLFEDLRQRLRSIRVLREVTPRAADALLAFGETISARILAAAFADHGLPAVEVDARRVVRTDDRFGCAEPSDEEVRRHALAELGPLLEEGQVPVLGGFIGATVDGLTTTLGRGGSDTTAAIVGAALGAEEIQIWTDVDGMMSADPRLVPAARTLARVSFAEAAELACYGARVLHPPSISPATERDIPVRVLNSLRPAAAGTLVLGHEPQQAAPALAAVASRSGVATLRLRSRWMRIDPTFLPRALRACAEHGLVPDVVVSSELAATLVLPDRTGLQGLQAALGGASAELARGRAIVCVVGSGLARDGSCRERVLASLARFEPDVVALGASSTAVTAVLDERRLEAAVRELHARFFEGAVQP